MAIYAFSLLAASDPSKKRFSEGPINMICNFSSWTQNYITTPEICWTSMLHCFWPAVQFSQKNIFSTTYLIVLARCPVVIFFWHLQCIWNCCLWLTVLTRCKSVKIINTASKFLRTIEDWHFVFSLLVRLIWVCETVKLSKSVLLNSKRIT